MTYVVRSLSAVAIAVGVAMFSWSSTLASGAVSLAANTTALIMGGTFHPLTAPRDDPDFVTAYLDNAVDDHLNPAFGAAGVVTNAVAVYGPEQFFPVGKLTFDKSVAAGRDNLHACLAASADCVYNRDVGSSAPAPGDALQVFGYSQSAVIASLTKRDLIESYQPGDPTVPFMLVANPMRPNGGVLQRLNGFPTIPILGISFPGASPTDGPTNPDGSYVYPTVDIVRQYDALGGDFPVRPLNLLATINALVGYGLLHGETVDIPFGDAVYQGSVGDTSYYLVETDIIPLLQPLAFIVPKPILKAIDEPLRVIIEDAYDRDVSPGTPTRARWWPLHHPVKLAVDVLRSLPVAFDDLTEGVGLGRVLRTTPSGTFGVGGPPLPAADDTALSAAPESTPAERQRESAERALPHRVSRIRDLDDANEVQAETSTVADPDTETAARATTRPDTAASDSGTRAQRPARIPRHRERAAARHESAPADAA